jgi:hypothetical protein
MGWANRPVGEAWGILAGVSDQAGGPALAATSCRGLLEGGKKGVTPAVGEALSPEPGGGRLRPRLAGAIFELRQLGSRLAPRDPLRASRGLRKDQRCGFLLRGCFRDECGVGRSGAGGEPAGGEQGHGGDGDAGYGHRLLGSDQIGILLNVTALVDRSGGPRCRRREPFRFTARHWRGAR